MKKRMKTKRFLILGVLLLSLILSACAPAAPQETTGFGENGGTTEAVGNENSGNGNSGNTDNTDSSTVPGNEVDPPQVTNDLPKELIDALTEYLQTINVHYDLITYSFADQINKIKAGQNAFHVTFDPDNYYYVCAYHNVDHEYEKSDFCCVGNYAWIKAEKATDISESIDGKQLIVAFQINKSKFCQNILPNTETNTTVEHFQIYQSEFSDGKNIAAPLVFNESFVYIHETAPEVLYYTVEHAFHRAKLHIFPCVVLEEQCYIKQWTYTVYQSGRISEHDLNMEFGAYYEDLMEVMITDQYSVETEQGNVIHYGLFEIEDIAAVVLK